jgi:agmatine deiminase
MLTRTIIHPAGLYLMPAEWAPHDACLMQYPHNANTFRLPKAREEFLQIAQAIANDGEEPVVIFCPNHDDATEVHQKLQDKNPRITTSVCPSDDTWCRDMGPTFVIRREEGIIPKRIGIDWDFNAWGEIYENYQQDQLVAQRACDVLNEMNIPTAVHKIPIVLEGGSIHVDGEGTILTTKECLLNENRNPTKSQQELETILCEALGANKVLWLPNGVDGDDDTNGHIDNFACFWKPGHIILSWTDDQVNDKVNYERCRTALKLLEQETDAKGRSLTVHKLQLPPPIVSMRHSKRQDQHGLLPKFTHPSSSLHPIQFYTEEEAKGVNYAREVNERMAGSYVNFYIANKAVVVPQYGCEETDRKAVETLAGLFKDRNVVGVPSKEILIGGGNIHCITQQVPKV